MASDRSRRRDTPHFGYKSVIAQQGRVVLDRDFNAQAVHSDERDALDALAFVGPSGSPDDGFRIRLIEASGSPPAQARDFEIAPGLMYLGGQAVTLEARADWSTQPEWPAPPPAPMADFELVYLDVTELHVGAVEDPDLLDVALGGPDTTGRAKLLKRIRRLPVKQADCRAAWQEAVAQWRDEGLTYDPRTGALNPEAALKIGFLTSDAIANPCDPAATGGYLGADNQLLRIRVVNKGGVRKLLWGYDNASFLYRVAWLSADRTLIRLAGDPPDAFHFPQAGQVVEILASAALLGQVPDRTDPSGVGQIVQAAAEPTGFLATLAQAYGPAIAGDPSNYLVLPSGAWPTGFSDAGLPIFVRVWQAAPDLTVNDPVTLADGVTATVSGSGSSDLPDGAYWEAALRPGTPQGCYPESLLVAPQLSDGPRRWACPLAVIDWTAKPPAVHDCRRTFDNLVDLSRRLPGCSTLSLSPRDLATRSLQDWLSLVENNPGAVVCLAAGDYPLDRPLRLDGRHEGLTIEACGGAARLFPAAGADPEDFADGVVALNRAAGVTLHNIDVTPAEAPAPRRLLRSLVRALAEAGLDGRTALRLPRLAFGFRIVNSAEVTLDSCAATFSETRPDEDADLIGAGVFVQGRCSGLRIERSSFGSEIAPTYTPLTLDSQTTPQQFGRILDALENAGVAERVLSHRVTPAAAAASPTAPATGAASAEASEPELFSLADWRDSRVGAGLVALSANRLATGAPAKGPVIATVGVLAADNGSTKLESRDLPCALGRASIADSAFANLTLATWLCASYDVLRLRDNDAENVLAGLWLEIPGASPPPARDHGQPLYPNVTFFEEFQAIFAFAAILTPPDGAEAPARVVEKRKIVQRKPRYALIVEGNHVRTPISTRERRRSSSALLLSLNISATKDQKEPPLVSTIIAGNHFESGAGIWAPSALIVPPRGYPCSITGNVILNPTSEAQDIDGASLVVLAQAEDIVTGLAVTGNVLRGFSNLRQLKRFNVPAPADVWTLFNDENS